MKKVMMGFLFLAAPSFAFSNPSLVYEVAVSSSVTTVVAVSSFTATQMDVPVLNGRVALEIQNQSATANLWCGPATANAAVNAGREILAGGNTWVFSQSNFGLRGGSFPTTVPMTIYCINDGASGTTNAAVSQAF